MRLSCNAGDAGALAIRAVLLGGLVQAGCHGAGCDRSSRLGAGRDAPGTADAGPPADARQPDAAVADAGAAEPDAGPVARPDAGPVARPDARPDAAVDAGAAAVCPPWRTSPATGRGWLYTRAVSRGVALTPADNHVDIYVRSAGAPLPGERADPDDPCAVASYDQAASRVLVIAAAIGFSSQEREFSPQRCSERAPCSIELPPSLEPRFYVASAGAIRVRSSADVAVPDRAAFAASVAGDALARAKALHRPLADELDRAEQATLVPAVDLAIRFTEAKLRRRCDASCLEAPAVDPAVRSYLRGVRRPAHVSPFELRIAPERWPARTR